MDYKQNVSILCFYMSPHFSYMHFPTPGFLVEMWTALFWLGIATSDMLM